METATIADAVQFCKEGLGNIKEAPVCCAGLSPRKTIVISPCDTLPWIYMFKRIEMSL